MFGFHVGSISLTELFSIWCSWSESTVANQRIPLILLCGLRKAWIPIPVLPLHSPVTNLDFSFVYRLRVCKLVCVCVCAHARTHVHLVSRVWLFVTPRTVARQVPLSIEFSRQEYWSELPFPLTRDLSNPGIKPRSPALQVDSSPTEPAGETH